MSTRYFSSIAARLLIGGVAVLSSASCGSDMLRTGRAPAYMVVTNLQSVSGPILHSDVQAPGKPPVSDNAIATIRMDLKNPTVASTAINAVTVTRYHVMFRRADGRNTPGVDVPYPFDGALTATADVGSSTDVTFELVRSQAKLESPLRNLSGLGGAGFISAIAEVTFYGRDQNGNEVVATASMDVQFGDFS